MTVTLVSQQAGLLHRTGHPWPMADEDRIAALADSWGRLGTRLDIVRTDHDHAARSIQTHNTSAGIAAFGAWTGNLDELLLRLVEGCARAQAWLLSIARWVYDTKTAISDTLDDLARSIDQAERSLSDVPIIGDELAAILDATVGTLVDKATLIIGDLLDRLTAPIIEHAVPDLVGLVATVQGIGQDLRKLLRGQTDTDWPTTPSHTPLPQNLPRGPQAVPGPNDNDAKKRALRLENEAARTLAQAGYDVEQIPERKGIPTQDYLIEGRRFDCTAPTTPSARNVWDHVKREKIERDQTDRVVININSPKAQTNLDDLRQQFQDWPIPGLVEAKVIVLGGAIVDIYP